MSLKHLNMFYFCHFLKLYHSTTTALLKYTNNIFCVTNDIKLTAVFSIDLTDAY